MLLSCGVGGDLRVPWIARRSNQSVLKEINPEYSLEGLIQKLKLQYLGYLMWRADSLEKTLMLGKLKAGRKEDRGWDGWMASPTLWTWIWASSRSWWWTGNPGMLQSMGPKRVGHNWATELNFVKMESYAMSYFIFGFFYLTSCLLLTIEHYWSFPDSLAG